MISRNNKRKTTMLACPKCKTLYYTNQKKCKKCDVLLKNAGEVDIEVPEVITK